MGRMGERFAELEQVRAMAALNALELVTALESCRDHLGCALGQVSEYDDPIIVEHMRSSFRAACDALRGIRP